MNKESLIIGATYLAMLMFCLTFWGGVVVACSKVAEASPLDCETIHDADARHYCRAIAKGDKLECELIKNRDLRAQCRALAEPKK